MHAVPVDASTANAVAGQKGSKLTIRHGEIRWRMAHGDGFVRHLLLQFQADAIGQFVGNPWIGKIRVGIALLTALQCQYAQAGFGQFHAHNGTGPAKSDNHHVYRWLFYRAHLCIPFAGDTDRTKGIGLIRMIDPVGVIRPRTREAESVSMRPSTDYRRAAIG